MLLYITVDNIKKVSLCLTSAVLPPASPHFFSLENIKHSAATNSQQPFQKMMLWLALAVDHNQAVNTYHNTTTTPPPQSSLLHSILYLPFTHLCTLITIVQSPAPATCYCYQCSHPKNICCHILQTPSCHTQCKGTKWVLILPLTDAINALFNDSMLSSFSLCWYWLWGGDLEDECSSVAHDHRCSTTLLGFGWSVMM